MGPKKDKHTRLQAKIPESAMDTAREALAHGRNMPKGATRQELLAYRFLLNKERKRLLRLRKATDATQVTTIAEDIERVNAEPD